MLYQAVSFALLLCAPSAQLIFVHAAAVPAEKPKTGTGVAALQGDLSTNTLSMTNASVYARPNSLPVTLSLLLSLPFGSVPLLHDTDRRPLLSGAGNINPYDYRVPGTQTHVQVEARGEVIDRHPTLALIRETMLDIRDNRASIPEHLYVHRLRRSNGFYVQYFSPFPLSKRIPDLWNGLLGMKNVMSADPGEGGIGFVDARWNVTNGDYGFVALGWIGQGPVPPPPGFAAQGLDRPLQTGVAIA